MTEEHQLAEELARRATRAAGDCAARPVRAHLAEFPTVAPTLLVEWAATDNNVSKSHLDDIIEARRPVSLVNDRKM
jgi:hypothetical protein